MAALSACFLRPGARVLAALACLGSAGCGDDVMRLGTDQQEVTVGSVERILLREAATRTLIRDLVDPTPISVASLPSPQLSLEAVVRGNVGSVEFVVDGKATVEIVVPFTFPGDIEGKLNSFAAVVGDHAIAATPYSLEAAQGERGVPLTFPFTFVP